MSRSAREPKSASWEASEPTRRELAAIETEWPLIAAELAIVDAEIAAARSVGDGSELGRRRVRRVQSARTRNMAAAARRTPDFGDAA